MEKSPRREGWGFVESEAGFRAGVYRYFLRNIVTHPCKVFESNVGILLRIEPKH